jgi:outer membrane protein TolC
MKNQLLVILVFTGIFSANSQTLNLETCLKMADTANLKIRNSQLDISINDKERDAYMAARLPHVGLSGDYKYNAIIPGQVIPADFFGGAPGTFSTVKFGVPYTLSNTVQLTQVLFNSQINYGLAALKVNTEIVEIQNRMVNQDVKQQVASTFFNLQAITKQLVFVNGNIANMDKLIKNMDAMVQQQLMIQTEVDKLQINKLSLVNSRESLQASKDQLETYLKILIGMDPKESISIEADMLVEKSILVDNAEIKYPELDLIAAQKKMNQEERKGTNMAYLPNLSFYASYNYNYNMKPDDNYRVGIQGAFLGLKMDWTLFDGLEKYHKQKVNAFNSEKLANQEVYAQQQLDMKTANLKRQIEVQSNSLEVSKEQMRLAERVYDQTKARFEQGTISSNDLITADNSLQQAQTNVVTSYIQLRQAELEYLRAIGNIK